MVLFRLVARQRLCVRGGVTVLLTRRRFLPPSRRTRFPQRFAREHEKIVRRLGCRGKRLRLLDRLGAAIYIGGVLRIGETTATATPPARTAVPATVARVVPFLSGIAL